MFRISMAIMPWDLESSRIRAGLDLIVGRLGIRDLALWMTLPPFRGLGRSPGGPRLIQSSGGCYYLDDRLKLGGSRIGIASVRGGERVQELSTLLAIFAEYGVGIRAVLEVGRMGRVAESHPAVRCCSLWGDPIAGSSCLNHPDLSGFFAGVTGELASRGGVAEAAISGLFSPALDAERIPGLPPAWRHALHPPFSDCFCESCRQRAREDGFDLKEVRAVFEKSFEKLCEGGPSDDKPGAPDDDGRHLGMAPGVLKAHQEWRTHRVRKILAEWQGESRSPLRLYDSGPGTISARSIMKEDHAVAWPAPLRPEEAMGSGAALEDEPGGSPVSLLAETTLPAQRGRILLRLDPRHPSLATPHETVTLLRSLREGKWRGVEFPSFSLLSGFELEGIRRAVRFVGRESGAE